MPAAAPSPGLIPSPAQSAKPIGTRPYGRKHFFGSPEDGPPKQVLAPGPMRPADGKARLARGQPSTEGDYNGLRQKHEERSTATRNYAPGSDRLARRRTRGKEVLEPHRRGMGT